MKKPTITQLTKELEAAKAALADRSALEKANEALREQLKKMLEPKQSVTLNPNDLFLEIQYDKEQKGEATTKNYWGKLVNATINAQGTRYFQLLGNDGIYRMFNKDKCVNKEEVAIAVEKLNTLRNAIR